MSCKRHIKSEDNAKEQKIIYNLLIYFKKGMFVLDEWTMDRIRVYSNE